MAQEIYGDRVSVGCSGSGRSRTQAENIESVRQAFSCSPMKSIRNVAKELELPLTTVRKILHKRATIVC